jgi:hypothetical protein
MLRILLGYDEDLGGWSAVWRGRAGFILRSARRPRRPCSTTAASTISTMPLPAVRRARWARGSPQRFALFGNTGTYAELEFEDEVDDSGSPDFDTEFEIEPSSPSITSCSEPRSASEPSSDGAGKAARRIGRYAA